MKARSLMLRALNVVLVLALALSGFTALVPARPVAAAGGLTLTIIAAPNLVVDSNALSPSTYAPKVATVIAKICNTTGAAINNVTAYIGNYTANTPGIYPSRTNPTVSGLTYQGTYAFTHLGGTADATRFLDNVPANSCVYQYWSFEYPHLAVNAANGNTIPTWGVDVKPTDDLSLSFDMWVKGNNGTAYDNKSYTMTMRNEISAMANKIKPNGNPSGQWFNTDTSVIYPGQTIKTNGILYRLGNINQGFDNDGDGVPDYNAWLQPFGDPAYDPSCFRLIGVTGTLTVTRSAGNPDMIIPIYNNLYFTNIPPDNTDVRGLIYYEFLAIRGACTVPISPYQEVASGSDNEKFNGDYGTGVPALMSYEPKVILDKTGNTMVPEPGTITYLMPFYNDSDKASAGLTLSSGGAYAPLMVQDMVPAGLQYACGSANVINRTPATLGFEILYSKDSGATWGAQNTIWPACATPGTLVSPDSGKRIVIRFVLTEPLPKKTGSPAPGATATFQAGVPTGYISGNGNPFIENCATASFGDAPPFAQKCATTMVRGNNSIGDFIWKDQDGDGIQDGGAAEPGLNNVTLRLYWNKNGSSGNTTIDAGEPLLNAVTLTVIDGKLYQGGSLYTGPFDAYDVVNGLIYGGGNLISGLGLINGYNVINGYLDMDKDGVTAGDAGDDGQVTGVTTRSQGATISNGVVSVTSGPTNVFAGYNLIGGLVDVNGDGVINASDTGTGLIGGYNSYGGANAVVLYDVASGYVRSSGVNVANATLSGTYGFAYLPNAYYIVEVVAADYDITTGYTATTPKQYAVNLSAGNVNNRTSDFGFGPTLVVNKYLTSANPAYEGENVTFNIDLTNKLPGDGTASGFCQYTVWATAEGPNMSKQSGNPVWTNAAGSYSDVNGPDANYANHIPGTNIDTLAATSFSLSPKAGNITKVEAIYSLYVQNQFVNDVLQARYWHTGNSRTGILTPNPTTLINNYGPGQVKQGIYAWNVTSLDTWSWSNFNGTTLEVGFSVQKQGSEGGDTRIYFDAMGFRITTDQICSGADTVIATLPFTDTYDAGKLQFVSATPPETRVTVSGSNSTIHWANLGPLYAGGTKTVQVTFKALDPGANSASTINYADAKNAYFGNGRKVNDASDNASVTINATGSIAGTVWSEGSGGTNGWAGTTGYENLGTLDFGIPGATVTLYGCINTSTGALITAPTDNKSCTAQTNGAWQSITSLTTNQNGYYKFDGLRMGFYYVGITLPGWASGATQDAEAVQAAAGRTCTTGTCNGTWEPAGNFPTIGSDLRSGDTSVFNPIGTLSGGVLTNPNEDILNVSFGYNTVPNRVYGKVYADNDGNGTQGSGEANWSSVTVQLWRCLNADCSSNEMVPGFSTTTGADGSYSFSNPTGGFNNQYFVKVTQPANTIQTADPDQPGVTCTSCDNQKSYFTLAAGQTRGSYDFGYQPTGSWTIGDTIYYDWNGNGSQDTGELGIPNITVYLYEDENNNDTIDAATDALIATRSTMYNLINGYLDVNNDGQITAADDTTMMGVSVVDGALVMSDGQFNGYTIQSGRFYNPGTSSYITDNTLYGKYAFKNLPNGNYIVVVNTADPDFPTNVVQTDDPDNSGTCTGTGCNAYATTAAISGADDLDNDWGYQPRGQGMIGDTVWLDTNGNGIQNTGESGQPNVTVNLYHDANGDGVINTATDPLVATTTTLGYTVVDGYIQSPPASLYGYTIIGGALDIDGNGSIGATDDGFFGPYRVIDGRLDLDNNGSVTDNADDGNLKGFYLFQNLPAGNFIVQVAPAELAPGGDLASLTMTNTDSAYNVSQTSRAVPLSSGQKFFDADFGFSSSAIGDLVWQDSNGDGRWENGEPGIGGVWMELYLDPNNTGLTNGSGVTLIRTTQTLYNIINGYLDFDNDGVTDGDTGDTGTLTLDGVVYTITNGKVYLNSSLYTGTLVGYSMLAGMFDVNGSGSVTVDDDATTLGLYLFGGLGANNYLVKVKGDPIAGTGNFASGGALEGYTLTADPNSYNTTTPSNLSCLAPGAQLCDGINWLKKIVVENKTTPVTYTEFPGLQLGQNDMSSDFGYQPPALIGDRVWQDLDGDGVQDAGEPGIAGVLVNLYADADNNGVPDGVIATATTNSDGYYYFKGRPAGNYIVEVAASNFNVGQPLNGYTQTGDPEYPNATCSGGQCDNFGDADTTSNVSDLSNDFGYQGNRLISGTLFFDKGTLGSIYQSGTDFPFSGIQIYLYDSTGKLIGSTLTNASGYYQFQVPSGTYEVRVADSLSTKIKGMTWTYEPDLPTQSSYCGPTPNTCNNRATVNVLSENKTNQDFGLFARIDMGDLPASYNRTLMGEEGPIHINNSAGLVPTIYLGSAWDSELDGAPDVGAGMNRSFVTGDDILGSDDEDGVEFLNTWYQGQTAQLRFTIADNDADYTPYLVGWFDWNNNGSFYDAGEMVDFGNLPAGPHTFNVLIPSTTPLASINMRFRLYATQSPPPVIAPTGTVINGEVEDYQKDNNTPTAVTLAAFDVTPQDDGILLTWETASELDNVGFNLYRSEKAEGPYVLLNATLIPPQNPGSVLGGLYEWLDTNVQPGVTYYYKLEDIDVKGVSTFHGPISTAFVTAPTAVQVQRVAARATLAPVALGLVALAGFVSVRRRRRAR